MPVTDVSVLRQIARLANRGIRDVTHLHRMVAIYDLPIDVEAMSARIVSGAVQIVRYETDPPVPIIAGHRRVRASDLAPLDWIDPTDR